MGKVFVKANVTKSRIAEAMKQNSHKCAISESIKAADSDIAWAAVTASYIEFGRYSDEMRYKFRTSIAVRQFIEEFDNDRSPKPFELTLTQADLIMVRPRQMRQSEVMARNDQRRVVAKATKQPIRKVSMADVEAYEQETGVSTKDVPFEIGRASCRERV